MLVVFLCHCLARVRVVIWRFHVMCPRRTMNRPAESREVAVNIENIDKLREFFSKCFKKCTHSPLRAIVQKCSILNLWRRFFLPPKCVVCVTNQSSKQSLPGARDARLTELSKIYRNANKRRVKPSNCCLIRVCSVSNNSDFELP